MYNLMAVCLGIRRIGFLVRRRGRKHRREYGKDSFAPLEHVRYERRKDSRHCRRPARK